jgi:hypothetical protein
MSKMTRILVHGGQHRVRSVPAFPHRECAPAWRLLVSVNHFSMLSRQGSGRRASCPD